MTEESLHAGSSYRDTSARLSSRGRPHGPSVRCATARAGLSVRLRSSVVAWGLCGALAVLPSLVAAGSLASIRDRGVLTVCAHPDALPFSSQNPAQRGFQIELAEAIARRLGVQLQVDWIVFARHARRADCDAVMGSIVQSRGGTSREAAEEGDTDQRQNGEGIAGEPHLTKPYASSGYVLVVSTWTPDVPQLAELKGGRVGIEHGSWPHYLLDKQGIPTASYLNQPEIIDAVARGEVVAGLVTDPYVGWFLKQRPGAVRISSAPMPPEFRWNMAVRLLTADPALLSAFNDSLDGVIADQTIVRIFSKYGITYAPPRP